MVAMPSSTASRTAPITRSLHQVNIERILSRRHVASEDMTRIRISTTVDAELLEAARKIVGGSDSEIVDEALTALLARHQTSKIDASYTAYDNHPLEEPDHYGDLASFRRTVSDDRDRQRRLEAVRAAHASGANDDADDAALTADWQQALSDGLSQ